MVAVEPVAVLISRSSVWVAVLAVADDTVAIVSESRFCGRCFSVAVLWVAVWHVSRTIRIQLYIPTTSTSCRSSHSRATQFTQYATHSLTHSLTQSISHSVTRTFSSVASPRGGGQTGQLVPSTSDRTPREIDADPRRFSCRKNGDRLVGLEALLPRFTCTDAEADFFCLTITKIRSCRRRWRSYFGRPSVKLQGPLGAFSHGLGPPTFKIYFYSFSIVNLGPIPKIADEIGWFVSFDKG